jgi:hypothetical protein
LSLGVSMLFMIKSNAKRIIALPFSNYSLYQAKI